MNEPIDQNGSVSNSGSNSNSGNSGQNQPRGGGSRGTMWAIIILVVIAAVVIVARANKNNNSTSQSAGSQTSQSNSQSSSSQTAVTAQDPFIPTKAMKLTSPAFQNNGAIPAMYTCDGQGVNPEIDISGVPAGAKSLAFVLHDPDAPVAGGFTHWVIYNMDPTVTKIEKSGIPSGSTQGLNGSKQNAYTGPCPPSGTHHYQFQIFALDKMLGLDPTITDKTALDNAMVGHVLDDALLVGTYSKAAAAAPAAK